ncbi:MAG: orotidine-5'-phosphate decarboxylase [Nitrospirae bacterium]|nr:orotidine-5'-phosphate decarboxylase [Nitrospirota bacterium]
MKLKEKLIVALDVSSQAEALDTIDRIGEYVEVFKVGFELFVSSGYGIVKAVQKKGKKVFLDLKFHDIPNTVARAAASAARLGVYMFNLHASGGLEMMKRCRESVDEVCHKENINKPLIIGVTVLTSIDSDALKKEAGVHYSLKNQVKNLSLLAQNAGLNGVVASPYEIKMIKEHCGKEFLVVTPGIRPSWLPPNDQRRTATPKEALKSGADYIVMGRGILRQDDPVRAIELISLDILTA